VAATPKKNNARDESCRVDLNPFVLRSRRALFTSLHIAGSSPTGLIPNSMRVRFNPFGSRLDWIVTLVDARFLPKRLFDFHAYFMEMAGIKDERGRLPNMQVKKFNHQVATKYSTNNMEINKAEKK